MSNSTYIREYIKETSQDMLYERKLELIDEVIAEAQKIRRETCAEKSVE